MRRRRVLRLSFAAASVAAGSVAGGGAAQAQAFPSQPVRVVVGFPPGGATDVIARIVAEGMAERLPGNRGVVVENRSGASGIVAGEAVAKAPPDGHTLMVVSSAHATLRELYANVPFDPVEDFAPIALLASTPYVAVVHPGAPANSMQELIALAKRRPGELSYAAGGLGTAQHLAGEMFKRVAGVDILHVSYRGSGAVRADLLAGRVQLMFDNIAVMAPYVRRGELRGLAVTGRSRNPLAPELPTLRELGLGGAEIEGWFALLAPAGTPPEVVAALNGAVNATLATDAVRQRLLALGAEPLGGEPEHVTALVRAEREKWGRVIREAGIRPE